MKSFLFIFSFSLVVLFSINKVQAQNISNDPCLKPRIGFEGRENQTSFSVAELSKLKGIMVYLNSGCRNTQPRYEITMFRFESSRGSFGERSCHGIEMYDLGETIADFHFVAGEKFTITIVADLYFSQYSFEYIKLSKDFLIV